MNKKRELGENTIYTFANYVWWFLLGNFYFLLTNIPFIFVIFSMQLSGIYSMNLVLILSLLPIGPSLTALFSIMGKLIREGDINVTKDFFKAYKVNFLDSLFFWSIEVIILAIASVDIIIFNNNSKLYFLKLIPVIISILGSALGLYIFPIISRFYLNRKDIFKLSLMYLLKNMHICLITFAAVFVLWIIFTRINGAIPVLFSSSIICYIVMFLEKNVLEDIEKKIKNADSSVQ